MNPYDEKRLRDEAIYLHYYLWHQGPPRNPQTRPRLEPQYPSNNGKRIATSGAYTPPKPDSGPDWSTLIQPQPPSPQSPSPGWPKPNSKSDHHQTETLSGEDQARFAALQMQSKVLENCKEFFNKRDDDFDDEEEEEEEGREYEFFMGLFVDNSELRGYYEDNYEKGEFFCLVCGGIGENVGKKYKECVGLVQHCMSISKTKRKRGHTAFGLVVCKVLGWATDRLPVILLKGEPLGRTLANSNDFPSQNSLTEDGSEGNIETVYSDVEFKNDASNCLDKGNDLNVILGPVDSVNTNGIESVQKEVCSIDQSNAELMVHENSLEEDDASKNIEDLEILEAEPNDGTVTDLELGSSQITSAEWPCIGPRDETTSTTTGWPIFKPSTAPVAHMVTAEEKIRFNMVQLQQNVSEACKQFFSINAGSDNDEDDTEVDGEDEDVPKESKEFNFLLRLFTGNKELRSYYETNFRGGDFCCLVCCGIGKKVWRTFKDCMGLLQHSIAISKTKKKRAHRAFGLVICKVLGWDMDRLPSLVLNSEPLSHSPEDFSQCPLDGKACSNKDESDAAMDKRDSESASKEDIDANQNSSMSTENSKNEEAAKGNDLENRNLNIGANEEKAVDSLNSSIENDTQPKADNIQVLMR